MGPSWGYVGLSWGQFGPILGLCWPILGMLAHLRARLAHLGAMLAHLAAYVLSVPVLNLLLNSSLNGWPLSIPRFFTRHFSIGCTASFDHLRCWCWTSCSWFGSRVFLFLPLPWNTQGLQLYASTVFQTSTFIPTSHPCWPILSHKSRKVGTAKTP